MTKLVEALMGSWGGRDTLPISLASKEMSREVRSGWSSPGRRRLWVTGWTVYSVFVTRQVDCWARDTHLILWVLLGSIKCWHATDVGAQKGTEIVQRS